MISGFSISPGSGRTFLIRAVGPTLANFGLGNCVANPQLTVYAGSRVVATNSGWSSGSDAAVISSAARSVGAFALPNGSADAAVLITLDPTLNPGPYTAQVTSADGTGGIALLEIYDISPPRYSHLKNLSARAQVGAGANVLIGGLVIEGGVPKKVLLRGAGPALGQFGLTGVLAKPQLTLFRGSEAIATSTAWSASSDAAAIRSATQNAGAFGFAEGSADAAMVTTLDPGAYTIQVNGADGGSGVALVEVYEVP